MSPAAEASTSAAAAHPPTDFISFDQESSEQSGDEQQDEESSDDNSSSDEEEDDDRWSSEDEPVTQEMLDQLLAQARENLRAKAKSKVFPTQEGEEEVITLAPDARPLPQLDPGPSLPKPYFSLPTAFAPPKLINDPGTSSLTTAASKRKLSPSPPPPSKRQKREMREKTAGPAWFDLPAATGEDLVKIKREMEANRLRAALDPKTFLRKEAQKEEIPKYIALGRIVPTTSPFTSSSSKNLTRAERKRSIVDELVADTEARAYAKRKFMELQSVREEKGRGTYKRRFKRKERKW